MGYGAKPEPAPVPASHVAPARSAEPDESAAQENLFAGLGALEQRSMVLLLCFVSGPPRRRNPAAANTVLSVAAHCRLSEQHVLEELDRVGSLQELETEFQLPAGLNVGTRCRELVVTSVVPDGGAAQAGLRLGDSVETIDGLRFTPGLGSQHLRTRAKEGPGTRILIRISRERCCDPFPVRPRQSGSCAPNPSPFTCVCVGRHDIPSREASAMLEAPTRTQELACFALFNLTCREGSIKNGAYDARFNAVLTLINAV